MGLLDVVAQIVETGGDLRFGHHRILAHSAANPLGILLHIASDFLLLHLAQRLTHFAGSLPLGGHQVAHRVLHFLFQLLEIGHLAVFLLGQLPGIVAAQAVIAAHGAAHLAFKRLLAAGQVFGLAGYIVHLVGGLSPAHGLHHLLGLFQTLRRAPRRRLAFGMPACWDDAALR